MMTVQERETVLRHLNSTRDLLLDAVDGITENQARWTPEPDRWSVLQYVEHLAVSDDGLVALVRRSLDTPAQPETGDERRQREQKIRATPLTRGVNQAPETLRPNNRFESLSAAVAAFLQARERTIDFAATTQEDLRAHFSPHKVLGPLDGYQWLSANARHVSTHVAHIQELRSLPEFPAA